MLVCSAMFTGTAACAAGIARPAAYPTRHSARMVCRRTFFTVYWMSASLPSPGPMTTASNRSSHGSMACRPCYRA